LRRAFTTSSGPVEVIVDEESRTLSVYRFDEQRRAVAATVESWDHADLTDVLTRQIGVVRAEAEEIASSVKASHTGPPLTYRHAEDRPPPTTDVSHLEAAGLLRRFVAVLLDAVIVLFPLGIAVGLLFGGGYNERENGSVNVGVTVEGNASWALLVLAVGYYIVSEALTGMTVGKRIVGIRVVREGGEHVGLGPAVVRNLLRPVDALFFYLVGVVFALTSSRRQRLGDRVAGTVVVPR
jgi:uncharacterized RDD family membrane protein YckC